MTPELEKVAAIIKESADSIMLSPSLRQRTGDESSPDRQLEASLILALGREFPNASFFAEERYKTDPRTSALLNDVGQVFIIDPIDNTTAFLEGRTDVAAVMVAMLDGGQLTHGWIYYPKLAIMMFGASGVGAYNNGQKISLRVPDSLGHATLAAFPNTKYSIPSISEALDAIKPYFAAVNERVSVCEHALDMLVGSKSHILLNRVPWPWDTCAFFAIYAAAGGTVGFADGSVSNIHGIHAIGQVVAPNAKLFAEVNAQASEATWPALQAYNSSNQLKIQSWGAPPAVGG